ncbi:MAG: sensor histidine kinase, partial [Chloroflexota bacterium]
QADEGRISQALTNLISNAIKYSPENTDIYVRVEQSNGEAQVSVSDKGIGLPPEQISLLFRPYSRLYRERRTARGTGLGLFITKGIVEAHGGRIWAESAGPNQGSTFHFTLPLQQQAPGQAEQGAGLSEPPVLPPDARAPGDGTTGRQ